ncbi:MAG: PilN domain-containing protein [Candidatus Omnitrophica bacterium]|nr:PilN domain-containing protein [Candidatus Omnitrophota bacterium]MDE2008554.1 PilN domain-containing protein [Candidatus Omnitrophota bacterium]MDE2214020.1 PilN domain-containing protein [Candidatus Omnitrophota bacterium]MDE2231002.1 PilN domain-containing protein [Candidatus Omnitrophota bacterium]
MIDINLIPEGARKSGKAADAWAVNIPRDVLLGVGGGVVVLLLGVHLLLGAVWLAGMGRLSFYDAQWRRIALQKTAVDAVHKETADLKKKISAISGVTVDRSLLWAPKFNAVSDALPRGLWIRKMTLDKAGLTIEGSVVSKTRNEINTVSLFVSSLKKDKNFMKGFSSLENDTIQGSRDNSVEVTNFSIVANLEDGHEQHKKR